MTTTPAVRSHFMLHPTGVLAMLLLLSPGAVVGQTCKMPSDLTNLVLSMPLRLGEPRLVGPNTYLAWVGRDNGTPPSLAFAIASTPIQWDTLPPAPAGEVLVLSTTDGVFQVCWAGWSGIGKDSMPLAMVVRPAAQKEGEEK